jgi:riboflavin kinase / FMN adenylyltransferase
VLKGAANIGIRPQFAPPKELLEPHFFDFAEEIYDQNLEVAFHAFLRGEAKFDSLDALTAQIEADCQQARDILG